MRYPILVALAVALMSCFPTKSEVVTCTTDVDCTSVQRGFRCDTSRRVCVCDGSSSVAGCALGPADGGMPWVDGGAGGDAPIDREDDREPADAAKPQCESNASCPASAPICSGGLCVGCSSAAQCASLGDPARVVCSAGGSCVQCLDDTTCSGTTARCDTTTKRCVQCLASAACPSQEPICVAGSCVPCTASSQCSTLGDPAHTLCSPLGTCVGCVTSASCPTSMPVCAPATSTCTACTASAQCAAIDPVHPVCSPTGACVQCTDASTCSGATPVCDPATSTCVQCLGSSHCAGTTPICSTPSHTCLACTTAAECAAGDAAHPACASSGACVQCVDDATCANATPVCSVTSNRCVQCLVSASCPAASPICDSTSATCVPCGSGAQCKQADPRRAACATTGECVECVDDSTCSGATPLCNVSSHRCVQCLASTDCSGATPICDPSKHACTGCTTAAQCASADAAHPACAANGACVQCTDNSTCSGSTPICDATKSTCRGCKADAECTSEPGVCMSHQDARCASSAETVVVTSTSASTSASLPGAAVPAGIHLVVIRGSVSGALAWSLAGASPISIVGQNGGTLAGQASAPTIHVSGGELYLRDLTVTAGAPGITADAGAVLRLDHVSISNNAAGGLLLDGAGFDIANSSVTGNGPNTSGSAVFGGIRIQGSTGTPGTPRSLSLSTFSFNQLIGITCDGSGAVSPAPTSVLASGNVGADIASACGFSSCGGASPTCGAQP